MSASELRDNLNRAICVFLELIRNQWSRVSELATHGGTYARGSLVADWLEANWEMLVEATVSEEGRVVLEPYGDGADCNAVGSRVWKPGVTTTHEVVVIGRSGLAAVDALSGEAFDIANAGLHFEKFVTMTSEGWYAERVPFDHALCAKNGRDVVFSLRNVTFDLRRTAW